MIKMIYKGKGSGFRDPESNRIWMEYCFKCGKENYASAVASGTCAWCSYDPNWKKEKKK